MRVRSLGQEDPLEEGMATHSSILVWRIPWTEEFGRLQSMDAFSHCKRQLFSLSPAFPISRIKEHKGQLLFKCKSQ